MMSINAYLRQYIMLIMACVLACPAYALSSEVVVEDTFAVGSGGREGGKTVRNLPPESATEGKWRVAGELNFNGEGQLVSGAGGSMSMPIASGVLAQKKPLTVEATVKLGKAEWVAVSLGKEYLAGDFFKKTELLLLVRPSGNYTLLHHTNTALLKGRIADFKSGEWMTIALTYCAEDNTVSVKFNGKPAAKSVNLDEKKIKPVVKAFGLRIQVKGADNAAAVDDLKLIIDEKIQQQTLKPEWTPKSVSQFYIKPAQTASLFFSPLVAADKITQKQVPYTILDYHDRVVTKGEAAIDASGNLLAQVRLEPGHYSLRFDQTDQTFGIASIDAYEGKTDPLFCIDSALSWLVVTKNHYTTYADFETTRKELVEVLKRSGVAMSRERVSWQGMEREPGEWEWETPRKFESLRKTYRAAGVPVLEMFHHAPAYLGVSAGGVFPQDLQGLGKSFDYMLKRWGGGWGGVEIWNEPNIGKSGDIPADQYVPFAKALLYSLQEAGCAVPVGGPAIAGGYDMAYLKDLAENGLLSNMDYLSYHTYSYATAMEEITGKYRKVLSGYGQQGIPLWITECGRPWENISSAGGSDRPVTAQGMVSALDNIMKVVESKACGIARHFVFVYPFYVERTSNFGVLDRMGTPLRVMSAYCAAIKFLSHMEYLGDMPLEDKSVRLARAFGNGKDAVLVLYTASAGNGKSIKLALEKNWAAYGIDGRKLSAAADTLPIEDGLVYLTMPQAQLLPRLNSNTPAMELYKESKIGHKAKVKASPIVLQFMPNAETFRMDVNGYHISSAAEKKPFPLTLTAFNMDSKEHTVRIRLLKGKDGAAEDKTVTIAAQGKVDVKWNIPVDLGEQKKATLTFAGDSQSAGIIQPVVINLLGDIPAQSLLDSFKSREKITIDRADFWTMSADPDCGARSVFPGQGLWQLEANFGKSKGHWAYPRLKLPAEVSLVGKSGMIVEARCNNVAGVRLFLWETAEDGSEKVGYITPKSFLVDDNRWHAVYIPFSSLIMSAANKYDQNNKLDIDKVRRISLGFNGKRNTSLATLEVRALWLVGK